MKKTQESQYDENYVITSSPLRRLILLVAFTAIMLITSTYAWFSVQNDVLISGINGTVKSVEGMMVSLDGTDWTHDLELTTEALEKYGTNILPEELLPVSTTAVGDLDKNAEVTFYTGEHDGDKKLEGITAATKGYYAIDVYVQNSAKAETDENGKQLYEVLQINNDSSISISGEETTGLQNTARVGIGVYTNSLDITSTGTAVTGATWGVLNDVTIWEPNANSHVDWVVEKNNKLTLAEAEQLTGADSQKTSKFGTTDIVPTYALTSASITAGTITDIYNWATLGTTGMSKQVTLQTGTGGIGVNPINLPSVDGTSSFSIPANRVSKLRVYLWLEGQDVDTINHASHGGTITVNLGLTKNEEGIPTISEIELDKETLEMAAGEDSTLTATVNADAEEELTWKSSDPTVATVEPTTVAKLGTVASTLDLGRTLLATTSEGKTIAVTIKALKAGETTITASNSDGRIFKECKITVTKKLTLAEITNDDIGEYIDLGMSLVGEEDKTTDDWRILWVDEEKGQVYAMLDDYLPNDVNGKNYAQLAGLNTRGTYIVNSTVDGDDLVNKLKSNWVDLAREIGIEDATVAGAPTGEMLQLSYNYKNDPDIVYTDEPTLTGDLKDMWVKPAKGDVYGYWLASSLESNTNNVWYVHNSQPVDNCDHGLWYEGVCPVVCLPSDINAEMVEGIWTVVK